jgi:hypothetical protein
MALSLEIEINLNSTDPDNPEAEQLAIEIATEAAHDYTTSIRERLEAAGVTVNEIGFKRGSD